MAEQGRDTVGDSRDLASGGPEDSGVKPVKRRPVRKTRGLGMGLGALIPSGEPELDSDQARPLDVLFPDLSNGTSKSDVQRGGSAKALLSPRGPRSDVSRETISRETRSSKSKRSAGARPKNSGTPVVEGTPVGSKSTVGADVKAAPDKATEVERKSVSRETSRSVDSVDKSSEEVGDSSQLRVIPGLTFGEVPPRWIVPNLKQPRQVFDSEELDQLAASLSEVGVLQPIVVRRIEAAHVGSAEDSERLRQCLEENPEARYELIMGERRWRAAQLAELERVPVIVRSTADDELLREALIENIHRVQLNPLEEAAAYAQLMEDFGYTQEEVANKVSKSRPLVANTLRLLKLPATVQRMLAAGTLSAGHARALLSLTTLSEMEALAERIVSEGLSVRSTEELIRFGKPQAGRRPQKAPQRASREAQQIADHLGSLLDTSVKVVTGARKGRLTIEFADQDDLERIAQALGLSEA